LTIPKPGLHQAFEPNQVNADVPMGFGRLTDAKKARGWSSVVFSDVNCW
jgi:hypothetical protein